MKIPRIITEYFGKVTGCSTPLVIDYSGFSVKYECISDGLYELQMIIIFKVYPFSLCWYLQKHFDFQDILQRIIQCFHQNLSMWPTKFIRSAEELFALKVTATYSLLPPFSVTKETTKSPIKSKDNPPKWHILSYPIHEINRVLNTDFFNCLLLFRWHFAILTLYFNHNKWTIYFKFTCNIIDKHISLLF